MSGNRLYVVRLNGRVKERAMTPEDDGALLGELARERIIQKRLVELVKKWRRSTYIDIRI